MQRYLILAITCLTLTCCSSKSDTADDRQEVVRQATDAARAVADTDHTDTLALQGAIVDARAMHDKYLLTHDPEAAKQFEKTFADSLRAFDPGLAHEIFP